MSKLTGMQVGRVDGVDRPAIRKRFVLVKNEDAAQVEKDYAGASRAVVEALAKEAGLSFSEETVEVLKTLVGLLELDVDFAAKSEDAEDAADEAADDDDTDDDAAADDEAAADDDDAAADDDEDADVAKTYSADEVEGLLAKFAAANGITVTGDTIAKRDSGTPESSASRIAPVSKQAKGQGDDSADPKLVRKGEGLYSNIVNGEASQPYAR